MGSGKNGPGTGRKVARYLGDWIGTGRSGRIIHWHIRFAALRQIGGAAVCVTGVSFPLSSRSPTKLTLHGVGGHSDWQLIGTIDYTPTPWIDLHLGYRSLNFTYTASGGLGLGFDVHMRGPILAATFKF